MECFTKYLYSKLYKQNILQYYFCVIQFNQNFTKIYIISNLKCSEGTDVESKLWRSQMCFETYKFILLITNNT